MPSPDTPHSLLDGLIDRGDSAAWGRFMGLYEPLVRGWVRRLIADEPGRDDVVQEVMAALLEALPEFRHNRRPGAFRSWLKTVTLHRIRRHWDRHARRPDVLGHEPEDPDDPLGAAWDAEHDRHVLRLLLDRVRPEFEPPTWRAFARTVLDDRPPAEVARELGLSLNAVYIAKARVLKRLRREGEGLIEIP